MRWVPLLVLVGCQTGSKANIDDSTADGLTWYDDVGPTMVERCGSCHRDGGIGPFSMETYEQVKPWAESMLYAVEQGTMPPWAAVETDNCTPDVPFRHDPRLSDTELADLRAWVQSGAAAGEPKDLPLPETGELEDPDVVLEFDQPFEISGDRDIYQCFRIEVPHDGDRWITGMQVIPDNDLVVHHVLVWNDPNDQSAGRVGADGSYPCSGQPDVWPTDLIGGWTPGSPPIANPEGTGTLFKAGASVVVNVHYHPTGDTTEIDNTKIALEWTDVKPANYVTYYMVDIPFGADPEDGSFSIPAGEAAHKETLAFEPYRYLPLPIDLPIFAIMPHMHYRGTDMKVWLEHPDGTDDTCVINAKDYRFDFQNNYYYDVDSIDEMPKMTEGDVMKVRCTYDNSWSNPFMEEALAADGQTDLVDVYWGEETGDEMCMAVIGIVIPPIDLTEWL